jgi:hypothetical protein
MLLQKNPLTMLGTISRCWLFAYRTRADDIKYLLPPELEPVQHHDYAFWNVVVCQVQNMRPKLVPLPVGVTYWHVAYRLYVRLHMRPNETVEGLFFLRSDCDNALMSFAGNILTDFNFHSARVCVSEESQSTEIKITAPGGDAYARINSTNTPKLSVSSAFNSLEEASQFLKYKPNGISISSRNQASVVRIVRDEEAWRSRLVDVAEARWSFFDDKKVDLEICYEVEPISYQWNRAEIHNCIHNA